MHRAEDLELSLGSIVIVTSRLKKATKPGELRMFGSLRKCHLTFVHTFRQQSQVQFSDMSAICTMRGLASPGQMKELGDRNDSR